MKNKDKKNKTMNDTKKTEIKEQEVAVEGNATENAAANGVENVAGQGAENASQAAEEQKELTREEQLEKQLAESEQKLAEASDKYVRMAAEFDNYRRRTAKERLDLIATAGEDVIKGLLPVLDDCERALQVLESASDAEAVKAAKEGTELIYNKLMTYLKGKGLSVIEAKDKELDTEFHEAVAQFPVEDKSKKNKIIDVVQQGYMLNGKVIRYAKVVVAM